MDEANIPPAIDSASPLTPAPPPESEPSTILHGPNGLRAGWRILIFLLIIACIVAVLSLAGHYAARRVGPRPTSPSEVYVPALRCGPSWQLWRISLGPNPSSPFWHRCLHCIAAHREFMVADRISRRLGLGPDVFLRCAGQRPECQSQFSAH